MNLSEPRRPAHRLTAWFADVAAGPVRAVARLSDDSDAIWESLLTDDEVVAFERAA